MKKYIVRGHYEHIKDLGVRYAKSLYDLVYSYRINYTDEDLETLEKELEETGFILFGDYVIELGGAR